MADQPQVLAGAEPFFAEGGKTGILVSHGYTGSPQSMRFLAEGFAAAGYTVALPRLKGHGTTPEDMAASTAVEWVSGINRALDWLKERCTSIFMTGLSMGGTLTLVTAAQFPGVFKGIIPINAAVFINNPDLASLALMEGAPLLVPGVGGDIKAPGIVELAYSATPVPTIKELFILMKAAEEMLPRIACPALIIYSAEDHIVPPPNAAYIYDKISSSDKRILKLENSYHVATLDNDKELILAESLAFIKANA